MKVIAPYHKLFKVQYFYLEIALESWWIVEPRALLSRLIIYSFSIIWSSAASEFDKIKVGEKTTYEKPGIFMVIKWNQTSFRRTFFHNGQQKTISFKQKVKSLELGFTKKFHQTIFLMQKFWQSLLINLKSLWCFWPEEINLISVKNIIVDNFREVIWNND